MTDTGRFQFANNFVRMFEIVRDLCDLGVDPVLLNKTNNLLPIASLDIKAFIYSHITKTDYGVIYVYTTKEDREKLGVTSQQICGNTSLIGYVADHPIWFISAETDDGGIQTEIRSSIFNVQEIAVIFGGGGHTYAAGFTTKGYKDGVVEKLLSLCKETIKKGSK